MYSMRFYLLQYCIHVQMACPHLQCTHTWRSSLQQGMLQVDGEKNKNETNKRVLPSFCLWKTALVNNGHQAQATSSTSSTVQYIYISIDHRYCLIYSNIIYIYIFCNIYIYRYILVYVIFALCILYHVHCTRLFLHHAQYIYIFFFYLYCDVFWDISFTACCCWTHQGWAGTISTKTNPLRCFQGITVLRCLVCSDDSTWFGGLRLGCLEHDVSETLKDCSCIIIWYGLVVFCCIFGSLVWFMIVREPQLKCIVA